LRLDRIYEVPKRNHPRDGDLTLAAAGVLGVQEGLYYYDGTTPGVEPGWIYLLHNVTRSLTEGDSPHLMASKEYVDAGDILSRKHARDADERGDVPIGSIVFWINTTPPLHWFKLNGGKFDVLVYPLLDKYLKRVESYKSGELPDWGGKYPVEWGEHARPNHLGDFIDHRTALPTRTPITAKTSTSIPDGGTRGFGASGSKNAYSDSASTIDVTLTGGDDVTRPPSVVGHYIIKHD
jgi:hypothetical protein